MVIPEWRDTWLDIAEVISRRSKCSRRKVGAVLVAADGKTLVGVGYNGAPAGFDEGISTTCVDFCPRARGETSLSEGYGLTCPAAHAEVNVLMRYPKESYNGGTIVVTSACCADCAKVVCNSGVKRAIMCVSPEDKHRDPEGVIAFMESCGLEVVVEEVV